MFKNGISIEDNFLSNETYSEVISLAEKLKFEEVNQERVEHYKHVFRSKYSYLTNEKEAYLSSFDKEVKSDKNYQDLCKLITPHISSKMKLMNKNIRYLMEPTVMRLKPGSFLRTHVDDYLGEFGFTYFINQKWMWDYNGILHFYDENSSDINLIFPKQNRILWRDESIKLFHYVSTQSIYAPFQYLLISFGSKEDRSDEKRNYLPII